MQVTAKARARQALAAAANQQLFSDTARQAVNVHDYIF
jgi:hypothetical protein